MFCMIDFGSLADKLDTATIASAIYSHDSVAADLGAIGFCDPVRALFSAARAARKSTICKDLFEMVATVFRLSTEMG